MESEQQSHSVTEEHVCSVEVRGKTKRGCMVCSRGVSLGVRAYRGFLWVLGIRQQKHKALVHPTVTSPRHSLTGRKRLHPATRLLLYVLPRWLHGALGFPVAHNIGRTLSPEIRASPTKPYGKGSKRKQDDIDEEDDEEDEQTWVDVLNQDLADEDEGPDQDPDYEPSSVSTESEEYCSQNNTQSDIEVQEKGIVIIEDVKTVR
uniref:Oogenesis-related gene n=1 Tax=Sphaeramia orbicularis TaxID=375764 RepID=A0A672YKE8_9TELE